MVPTGTDRLGNLGKRPLQEEKREDHLVRRATGKAAVGGETPEAAGAGKPEVAGRRKPEAEISGGADLRPDGGG